MNPLKSVDHLAIFDALFRCFLESGNLVLGGLEEEPDPVGVVVHGEVCEPSAGVSVDDDLVALLEVDDDGGACHRVLVVVLVVLQRLKRKSKFRTLEVQTKTNTKEI